MNEAMVKIEDLTKAINDSGESRTQEAIKAINEIAIIFGIDVDIYEEV